MKTREHTKPEEPRWYESAAHPSTPGELVKTKPADLTQAEPEENTDASVKHRWLRWIVGIYVVVATIEAATGNAFYSVYWASLALFFAIAAQPRERVPKLLRYFAAAAVVVTGVVQIVLMILKMKR